MWEKYEKKYTCAFSILWKNYSLRPTRDYSLKNDYHMNLGQFLVLLKKTLKWACFQDIIWYQKQKFWLLWNYEEAFAYNLIKLYFY